MSLPWPGRSPSRPKPSFPPLLSPSPSARPSLPLHAEKKNIRRELPASHPAPNGAPSARPPGWLRGGGGRGGRGTVAGTGRAVQGAILPSSALAPTPCFFLGIRLPHTGPSPPFMKSHTVLSPPSLQREPRTPNPAPSTSNSVSNPALPGMATEYMQCLLRAGQHWASPCCRAKVG